LRGGFEQAEKTFLELAQNNPSAQLDRSGSCALVILIVGEPRSIFSPQSSSKCLLYYNPNSYGIFAGRK
jgi:hypothetical protein